MSVRRTVPLILTLLLFFLPVSAAGKTDARCGLSVGLAGGVGVPTDLELKDEFIYLYHIEANAKYYFLYVFSGSADLGYEYGQGAPKRLFHEGEVVELDGRGLSFWRAMPFWGTLRLEPFRHSTFNPYVGAAIGGKYLVMERKGRSREIAVSGSGSDWVFGWMGVAGFDYLINNFIFFRLEGRYSEQPSNKVVKFFEERNFGTYDVLAGINIYF